MPKKAKQRVVAPPKSPGGADKQTLYKPEYDTIAGNLVRLTGATISEVAEILSVSVATIYNWQARHESFRLALHIPETIANHRVELSCYNEAVGYFIEEEEIKVVNGEVLRLKKKVWQRPNPTAIVWWTKVKGKWIPSEPEQLPSPQDDGATTIDQSGKETDKQVARRLMHVIEGGKRSATG